MVTPRISSNIFVISNLAQAYGLLSGNTNLFSCITIIVIIISRRSSLVNKLFLHALEPLTEILCCTSPLRLYQVCTTQVSLYSRTESQLISWNSIRARSFNQGGKGFIVQWSPGVNVNLLPPSLVRSALPVDLPVVGLSR